MLFLGWFSQWSAPFLLLILRGFFSKDENTSLKLFSTLLQPSKHFVLKLTGSDSGLSQQFIFITVSVLPWITTFLFPDANTQTTTLYQDAIQTISLLGEVLQPHFPQLATVSDSILFYNIFLEL